MMERRCSATLRIQLIRHSLGVLAYHNVLAQGRKFLGFQLIQIRRKSLRKRRAGITDKCDLKTGCKQIAAYFIWCSEETDCGRGGPRERVAGFSRRTGPGQG